LVSLKGFQSKVFEGDAGSRQVALALASCHAVEPAHVNASTAPKRCHKDDSVEGVAHPLDVVATADVEVSSSAILGEPDVDIAHGAITSLIKKVVLIKASSFYYYIK
jgi:hypothetical protein